jgi:hypothetical protein
VYLSIAEARLRHSRGQRPSYPAKLSNEINGLHRVSLTVRCFDRMHCSWLERDQRKQSFQPMMPKNNILTIMARWPVAIIALGIALTVIWICVLIWLPLRLLDIL